MKWIGITGLMGSGKTTVANKLRQMGFPVLDADSVSHQVLSPGSPGEQEVLMAFGERVLNADGSLDRKRLGRLVFGDPAQLLVLEKIVHPRVRVAVANERRRLEQAGHSTTFYDVPLLFEKNMQDQFDHILVVSADADLRRKRIQLRSQLSDAEIAERNQRQLPAEFKEAAASKVIYNNGTIADLERNLVAALHSLGVTILG